MSATADPARIVVGVDGSASSIEALRYAAKLATALAQSVDVVTTWVPPIADSYIYHGDWRPENDARSLQNQAITEVFGDTLHRTHRAGYRWTGVVHTHPRKQNRGACWCWGVAGMAGSSACYSAR